MNTTVAWLVWLLVSIVIVIIGFTGSLGKVIAVAFSPGILEPQYGGSGAGEF